MLTRAVRLSERAIEAVSQAFRNVGGGILAVMMFLTAWDVILRYCLNYPIPGSVELTEVMLVVVVLLGMGYIALKKENVRVDVLTTRLPAKAQVVLESISSFIALVLSALIAWQAAVYSGIKSNLMTAVLHVPIPPFYLVVAAGSALLCLVFLRDLSSSLNKLAKSGWKVRQWLIPLLVLVLLGATAPLWLQTLPAKIAPLTVGYVGLVIMVLGLFSGMPIGFVMALVGFLGMLYVRGAGAGWHLLGTVPYGTASSYALSVVPLFVLMGTFCFYAGISSDLYNTAHKWLGQLRGGLAMATIGACAIFSSVSGSSVACAATFTRVTLPEMKKHNYDLALATGSIAAGGTLDILIPPSVAMIIYAILTDQSIGKLFLAGFIPGIIEALFYIATVYFLCKRNPNLGPAGPSTTLREKFISLKNVWTALILFVVVIGGLYAGVFTPTEAGGVGAFGAFVFALGQRRLSWRDFWKSISDATSTTAMIFLIIIGAMMLNHLLAATDVTSQFADFIVKLALPRYLILTAILVLYIILGAIMDELAMMLLTVPIFFPVVIGLGFDPIWFGIIIIMMCVFGMIAPPVGMVVFVVAGVAKDIPMSTVYRGVLPFFVADLILLVLLVAFPQISLFLPNMMK